MFREIIDLPEGEALLFHCSQGKDRTGCAAMLILSALGVDEETATEDACRMEHVISDKSFAAIKKQVGSENYEYFNFVLDGTRIGYFAVAAQPDNTMMLSKLYMYKEYRGNGYAKKAFEFIKDLARQKGCKSIWLTVNRHNYGAMKVYEAFGMKVIREQVTDIGNGFVMDDYVYSIDV